MLLYHYNQQEFSELLSRSAQGLGGENKFDKDGYPYNDSISFFFEPIPLNIAELLHGEHHFWKTGVELFQHIVDSNSLPIDILYRIVESPEVIKLLYEKQDWGKVKDQPELKNTYLTEISQLEKRKGYKGEGRLKLVSAARPLSKGIEGYYKELYKLHGKYPEDELLKKYAACVPHVMIYPSKTPIKVMKAEKIILQ